MDEGQTAQAVRLIKQQEHIMAKITDTQLVAILEQVSAEELEGAKITILGGLFQYESEEHQQAVRIIQRIKDLVKDQVIAQAQDRKAKKA